MGWGKKIQDKYPSLCSLQIVSTLSNTHLIGRMCFWIASLSVLLILATTLEGEPYRYDACFLDAETRPVQKHEMDMWKSMQEDATYVTSSLCFYQTRQIDCSWYYLPNLERYREWSRSSVLRKVISWQIVFKVDVYIISTLSSLQQILFASVTFYSSVSSVFFLESSYLSYSVWREWRRCQRMGWVLPVACQG